jgi:hypothetical protein
VQRSRSPDQSRSRTLLTTLEPALHYVLRSISPDPREARRRDRVGTSRDSPDIAVYAYGSWRVLVTL